MGRRRHSKKRKSPKKKKQYKKIQTTNKTQMLQQSQSGPPTIDSLLDHMEDNREFESLLRYKNIELDIAKEIRKSLSEIYEVRKRPLICYAANIVNARIKAQIGIDFNDDLPFSEMVATVPEEQKEIDVIVVTPGGLAEQVSKFVDKLRNKFEDVSFIIPNMSMSAGTILVMSGNNIIMGPNSYIGPVDPQVVSKEGRFLPAQALLTLIDEIQKRGEEQIKKGLNPQWTDLQILSQLDGKEIGNAINASKYSIELVENYLINYKFSKWTKHSDGREVTAEDKEERAKEIAELLCSHDVWKTHSRGITREIAWEVCKIKITNTETISNLERVIRRFWALLYWIFENTPVYKIFISENYCIFRHDISLIHKTKQHG